MTHLCITARWLDERYHGLLSRNGPPEWPPSPYRLFQALVAGVARSGELETSAGKSLGWLQSLDPPLIIAPRSQAGQAITRFVPNNDGDKKPDRQERLTAKPAMPTLLLDPPEIHYVWRVEPGGESSARLACQAARRLTCLGWGIDMAYGDGRLTDDAEIQKLAGIRWYSKPGAISHEGRLRVPLVDQQSEQSTLCDLRRAHASALNRIEQGKPLKTVDKPKIFDRVVYTSIERPLARPRGFFRLIDDNGDPYRYPHAKLIHIAGMTRHAAIDAMKDDPPPWIEGPADWINRAVRGKCEESATGDHERFSYIPVPSIGHEHADATIRNVMIVAPFAFERELEYLCERLDGVELEREVLEKWNGPDRQPEARSRIFLERFTPARGRFIDICYLGRSRQGRTWHTVTPVILPGHNDHSPAKTIKLIQKALAQSGIEQRCEIEDWGAVPYLKNCLSAHKYDRNKRRIGYYRPDHLDSLTMLHMRLRFERPYPGPLVIGAGRHCGFGLFAAAD